MMTYVLRLLLPYGVISAAIESQVNAAEAAAAGATASSNDVFSYVLVGIVALAILFAWAAIRAALGHSTWSLSDALSEEANISPLDQSGKPIPGPDGKPQIVSELRASSSRLIALIGLVAIVLIYAGFGLSVMQRYVADGTLPDGDKFKSVITFLLAGVGMFAPYIVNKFASVFETIAPKN
jgi:hypothetical protein